MKPTPSLPRLRHGSFPEPGRRSPLCILVLIGAETGKQTTGQLIAVGRVETQERLEFSTSGRGITQTQIALDQKLPDVKVGEVETESFPAGLGGRLPIASLEVERGHSAR